MNPLTFKALASTSRDAFRVIALRARSPADADFRRRLIGSALALATARLCAFAAAVALSVPAVAADRFKARVEHVSDGDSITVRADDGRRLKIRLAGIDAPEIGQAHSLTARDQLRNRIDRDTVEILPVKTDVYGRLVARVMHQGDDLALLQVAHGLAWHFERYLSDQTPREQRLYRAAQDRARARGLGLWQDPDPTPPWDYRSAQRRR